MVRQSYIAIFHDRGENADEQDNAEYDDPDCYVIITVRCLLARLLTNGSHDDIG